MVAGSVVVPLINQASLSWFLGLWALGGFALHVGGQWLLGYLRTEEGYE
jgi:hypothetical protein